MRMVRCSSLARVGRPPTPASKGCARLSVANQEALLAWLGLLDATEETWLKNQINLTVNVQGEFVGR